MLLKKSFLDIKINKNYYELIIVINLIQFELKIFIASMINISILFFLLNKKYI